MRQSELFTRTTKELPKDETSYNAKVLIRAGFIDKVMAGVYTFLPLGLRVHNKIINIVREEMNAIGGQEILMPALTPKENWQITNRWDNFDALFKFKGSDSKEYALGATHEEIVTPLVKEFVFSYKNLPTAVYQIQTKFRNEPRAKAGLIRGREFSMKDLYSFHRDEEDLNTYYKAAQKAYFKVYERCGLLDKTYLTYASGGAFSKYSHEFQTVCPAGEDLIYICDACTIAINHEIAGDQPACPACGNQELHESKSIEVGNIFKLMTRFSQPFNFNYTDENGEKKLVTMGCYGIGPSRLMGAIVECCHDERGIVWPTEVAPFAVHLILIDGKEAGGEARKTANQLYKELVTSKVEVLFDDRLDIGPGEKFADADLIGCPYRVVVSPKTMALGAVEIKKRSSDQPKMIKIKELMKMLDS